MTPLEYIALARALMSLMSEAGQSLAKIRVTLSQNTEMSEADRIAFQDLLASDHAKDYWQAN